MKPKIVVITDGHVTDINLQEGPDVAKPTEIEEVCTHYMFFSFLYALHSSKHKDAWLWTGIVFIITHMY